MTENEPANPILPYGADDPPVAYPPRAVVLLLTLPMAALAVFALPPALRLGYGLTFRAFWYLRTLAILTALVSIFLVPAGPWRRMPWPARLNLLLNLPGLALAVFGLLRWVVVNMPSPA